MTLNKKTIGLFLSFCFVLSISAQERFDLLKEKLITLSDQYAGLKENIELSVNGTSVNEVLRAIAKTKKLNISVDESLTMKVNNNFSNAQVIDVLIFLCREFDLEIDFVGSIISFKKSTPQIKEEKQVIKKINLSYDPIAKTLSYDLKNDTLSLVLKEIAKTTGVNMVSSSDLWNKMVNGYIQNVSIKVALDKLALANDLKINTSEDGSFFVERKENNTKNKNIDNTNIPLISNGSNFKLESDNTISVKAVNAAISDLLIGIANELKINYYLFSEIKGAITLNTTYSSYDDFLTYLFNGTEYTFKKQGEIYLIGNRAVENLRSHKVIALNYRTVDKLIDFIPTELKKDIELKVFPNLNSLIASGSLPKIEELELFLRQLDKPVPVIKIDVIIADIRNTKTVSTGIEAGLGKTDTKTQGTVLSGIDLSLNSSSINSIIGGINGFGLLNLGKVTPQFYINIKALEEQGFLKLKSTPTLSIINGENGKMSIGKTEYYLEIQNNVIGTQNPSSFISQQYKSVTADLGLDITAFVSEDDQITLTINVKQSNFTERISPSAPPGNISRNFQSSVRVKNEEMVILGGLEENSVNNSGKGIPFLSRIPIIKWLFSSRTRTKGNNKLTIFITPKVIR